MKYGVTFILVFVGLNVVVLLLHVDIPINLSTDRDLFTIAVSIALHPDPGQIGRIPKSKTDSAPRPAQINFDSRFLPFSQHRTCACKKPAIF
jgi:hypothetical protein